MKQSGQYDERETPPDGNQQSTNTACGGMLHNPRAAEQTNHCLNWSYFIQKFIHVLLLLFFIFPCFMIKSVKKDSRKATEFVLNNICPGGAFAVLCATLWRSSCRQRGQQSAGCRPEQCYYRLSLNQASIRIHHQRERCSGRGEREVKPKHPRAGANRRNAPKAKMVNQRLKDNLGQISERQYSGRKLSNYSKPAKRKGRRAWTFVLTKVQDRLPVINESPVCRVFKEKRRRIQCHHDELISFTFNQQILISENREMQMCHILYIKIKK